MSFAPRAFMGIGDALGPPPRSGGEHELVATANHFVLDVLAGVLLGWGSLGLAERFDV